MKKITLVLIVLISIFTTDQVYGFQKEEKKFSREQYHAVQKLFILEKFKENPEGFEKNSMKMILQLFLKAINYLMNFFKFKKKNWSLKKI